MRITKVNIPKSEEANDGLSDVKMDKLSQVVLLAGKNGSGKTIILNKIFNTLPSKPSKSSIETAKRDIRDNENGIDSTKASIEAHKALLRKEPNPTGKNKIRQRIDDALKNIEKLHRNTKEEKLILSWNLIETSQLAEAYRAVYFVPKHLDLKDATLYKKPYLYE